MAFIIVFSVSLVAAGAIVATYSLGIRFLATPAPRHAREDGTFEPDGPARDDEDDDVEMAGRPAWATFGAYGCFTLSGLFVAIGIFLIVTG